MRLAMRLAMGVCALAVTLAMGSPSADTVMDEYLDHYGKVAYSASEFLQERQTDGETARVVNVVRQKPGRDYSRFLYSTPAAHKGIVSADDGSKLVIYVPNESRIYEYPSGAEKAQGRRRTELQRLRDKFDVVYKGTEIVADRTCHHIQLKPKEGRGPSVDVWIDADQFVALRQEVKSGDRVWRASRFKKVDFGVSFSDSDFRFTPPSGTNRVKIEPHPGGPRSQGYDYDTASEVRSQAGFRIMEPSYVPPGFRRQTYQVGEPRPGALFHRRLAVRFANGNQMLILNQGINGPIHRGPGGDEPERPVQMKPGLFFWTLHEIRLLLIGPRDYDSDELRKCAESVDWYDAGGKDGHRQAGCSPEGLVADPRCDRRPPPHRFANDTFDGRRDGPSPPKSCDRSAKPERRFSAELVERDRPVSPRELEEAVMAKW